MKFFGIDRLIAGELRASDMTQPKPQMRESRSSSLEAELLSTKSLNGVDVDREVLERTKRLMRECGIRYSQAFKNVLASDTSLAKRYRAAHQPLALFL